MRSAIGRCQLDLSGFVVFTEAASGAYIVTPVLAALAGATRVYALTRTTRHGTLEQISSATTQLAELAGVSSRIQILSERSALALSEADIVTNSGHVRPLDAGTISCLKTSAVVPLMYERWEFRDGDVDLAACKARGIRVTGTNERHPGVDVFSFLGPMAVKLLMDAGCSVYTSRILMLCDNDFAAYMAAGLTAVGADLVRVKSATDANIQGEFDAVLVSRTPGSTGALSSEEMQAIAQRWPGAIVAVYWGDVDRRELQAAGLSFWPRDAPVKGHMGILPSDIGPEAIVRLQSGSLKAAEALLRHPDDPAHPSHAFGQPI